MRTAAYARATNQRILWAPAHDTATSDVLAKDSKLLEQKKKWLQYHNKKCGGQWGAIPLVQGMRVSLIDHIDRSEKCLLRDRSGTLTGWVLDDREGKVPATGDVLLNYTPKVLLVHFEGATWQIDGLDQGTYPLIPIGKYWSVDPQGKALKVKRTQQPVAPDYARTAYTAQGMTLPAAIVDLCFDDNMDPATAYVALSRVQTADDILIMQAFNIKPFTQGSPLGPALLMKKLRGEDIQPDVDAFLAKQAEQRKEDELKKAFEIANKEEQKKAKRAERDTKRNTNLSDQQRHAKRRKDKARPPTDVQKEAKKQKRKPPTDAQKEAGKQKRKPPTDAQKEAAKQKRKPPTDAQKEATKQKRQKDGPLTDEQKEAKKQRRMQLPDERKQR